MHPCFMFLKNGTMHSFGVHFYGKFNRGMFNVEGSRKAATDRT